MLPPARMLESTGVLASRGSYVVEAFTLIVAIFCVARKIPAFVLLSALLIVAFAVATVARGDRVHQTEWIVAVAGLSLWMLGLLIVRVMLNRSVSLQLLAHIDSGRLESLVVDIGGRLRDMVALGLIRSMPEETWGLTLFGRLVSGLVIVAYAVFRIES